MAKYTVGQTVWIAYTLAKFPAIVTGYTPSDGYSQGQVRIKEIMDPLHGWHGVDLGNYPDNIVFDHDPKQVKRSDDYGEYTVWE